MIDVRRVPEHLAIPFVQGACRRYELSYDRESGQQVVWWASIDMGSIRALSGWAPAYGGAVLLIGPFGDGSRFEEAWLSDTLRAMQQVGVPYIVVPASPSLDIRRQSAQLELGDRTLHNNKPRYARAL